uniref:Carbohydrate kinase PfkB domain-containing protein n=1 Tax=Chenopodium quinoa TaxID=63459 RepID=A0A803LW25_CHEQI
MKAFSCFSHSKHSLFSSSQITPIPNNDESIFKFNQNPVQFTPKFPQKTPNFPSLSLNSSQNPTPENLPPLVVVGSANADIYVEIDRLPKEGETISAKSGQTLAGGKGANQAVCGGKLLYPTYFFGQIGEDANGRLISEELKNGGVFLDYLRNVSGAPTGHAVVMLQSNGENSIIIVGGANMSCWPDEIDDADLEIVRNAGIVLLQREIPDSVNIQVAKYLLESLDPLLYSEFLYYSLEEAIFYVTSLKLDGNSLFNKGEVSNAFDTYNKAFKYLCVTLSAIYDDVLATNINLDHRDLIISLHLNIVACAIKLNKLSKAIVSCSVVLMVDKRNVKAPFRRGLALGDEVQRLKGRYQPLPRPQVVMKGAREGDNTIEPSATTGNEETNQLETNEVHMEVGKSKNSSLEGPPVSKNQCGEVVYVNKRNPSKRMKLSQVDAIKLRKGKELYFFQAHSMSFLKVHTFTKKSNISRETPHNFKLREAAVSNPDLTSNEVPHEAFSKKPLNTMEEHQFKIEPHSRQDNRVAKTVHQTQWLSGMRTGKTTLMRPTRRQGGS